MDANESEAPTYGEFFPSAWAKIARADRHRKELGEVIDAWQQREPVSSELEIGDDAAIFRAVVREPLPPEVPCIVGDLVHNLRAALDHAVYACVDQPGDETCQFPSLRDGDAAHFSRSQWAKRVKKAVPVYDMPPSRATKLREVLQSLDPYIGGDHEFIWLLTYLDNVDKHRLVLALSAAVETTSTVSDMAVTNDLDRWLTENEAAKVTTESKCLRPRRASRCSIRWTST